MNSQEIVIASSEYWVKVVGMLQQNWAILEQEQSEARCRLYFVSDVSGVFDWIDYPAVEAARAALRKNGFERYSDNNVLKQMLEPPIPPFVESKHPNGRIYSSRTYWKD